MRYLDNVDPYAPEEPTFTKKSKPTQETQSQSAVSSSQRNETAVTLPLHGIFANTGSLEDDLSYQILAYQQFLEQCGSSSLDAPVIDATILSSTEEASHVEEKAATDSITTDNDLSTGVIDSVPSAGPLALSLRRADGTIETIVAHETKRKVSTSGASSIISITIPRHSTFVPVETTYNAVGGLTTVGWLLNPVGAEELEKVTLLCSSTELDRKVSRFVHHRFIRCQR